MPVLGYLCAQTYIILRAPTFWPLVFNKLIILFTYCFLNTLLPGFKTIREMILRVVPPQYGTYIVGLKRANNECALFRSRFVLCSFE